MPAEIMNTKEIADYLGIHEKASLPFDKGQSNQQGSFP